MPAGQSLINAALQWLGEIEDDEAPSTTESDNALAFLNRIIDNWNIREAMATSATIQSVALTSGLNSAVLGTRVSRVVSANVTNGAGPTWPVKVVNAEEWNQIEDKDSQSQKIETLFYDRGVPTGTIYVAPRPSSSGLTAVMVCWLTQASFATLAQNNTLLPGYELGLVTELAMNLAPNYEVEPSEALTAAHDNALAEIARLNASLWVVPQAQEAA